MPDPCQEAATISERTQEVDSDCEYLWTVKLLQRPAELLDYLTLGKILGS